MSNMVIDAVGPQNLLCILHFYSMRYEKRCHDSSLFILVRILAYLHGAMQGYNDNSGLGPILSHYLDSASDSAKVLVLIMNQQGDHQMETYFNNTSGNNISGNIFTQFSKRTPSTSTHISYNT